MSVLYRYEQVKLYFYMNETVLNPYEINELKKRRKRMTIVKKLMTGLLVLFIIKPFCWTAPVLSRGRLYIRNSVGDLVCVAMRM